MHLWHLACTAGHQWALDLKPKAPPADLKVTASVEGIVQFKRLTQATEVTSHAKVRR